MSYLAHCKDLHPSHSKKATALTCSGIHSRIYLLFGTFYTEQNFESTAGSASTAMILRKELVSPVLPLSDNSFFDSNNIWI